MHKSVEAEMAEQLVGFAKLSHFRRSFYWLSALAGVVAGSIIAAQQGAKQGYLTGFLVLISGMAGIKLLTAPIGAVLWYRHWHCPACHERLGIRVVEHCPRCKARLFAAK